MMSRLRRSDDIYITGLWRNSILSDMLWRSDHLEPGKWGQPLEPRPARLVPSWSWASVQNAKAVWPGHAFLDTTKIVSLDYTAIGAAHLGEVSNASIVLSRDVNNQSGLIGLIDSNQSAHSIKPISRFFCINQANLKIFVDLLLSWAS